MAKWSSFKYEEKEDMNPNSKKILVKILTGNSQEKYKL